MSANYSRIHDGERQEHYVYRMFGRADRLLYVGCTMDLSRRLAEHRRTRMGRSTKAVTVEGPYNYETARRIERAAIEAEAPKNNIEWTPRHRRGVPYYKLQRRSA